MPEHWDYLVNRIRGLLDSRRGLDQSDADLLEQFIVRREEAAFATLVERHGPMVLGVCRRVLHGSADAEDAFQVTFLTLAARARSLRHRQALASWLYRVAYFVSLRALKQSARKRQQEVCSMVPLQVCEQADPARAVAANELANILDDELNRLPEKYRAALVLCGLEGKTSEEAARELGWPPGSMSRRLAKARDLLRQRLTRLGFAVPAAGLAALLPQQASAAVPPALAERTIQHGMLLVAGQAVEPATLGAGVASLLQETLRSMMVSKVRVAGAIAFVLALIGTAASLGLGAFRSPPDDTGLVARAEPEAKADGRPAADPLPEGAVARFGALDLRHGGDVKLAGFVNDGKRILTVTATEGHREGRYHGYCRLWDAATRREISRFATGDEVSKACLSPDGRRLAIVGHNRGELFVHDVAAGKLLCTIPRTPKGGVFTGFSEICFAADGSVLASVSSDQVVRTWEPATGKLLHEMGEPGRDNLGFFAWPNTLTFTPDGKTLACSHTEFAAAGKNGLRFWDVATGKALPSPDENVADPADLTYLDGIVYAPDGKSYVRPRKDATLSLCAAATGKEIRRLGEPRKPLPMQGTQLARIVFAPDGKTVVVRDHDSGLRLRLYDVATGKEVRQLGDGRWTGRLDPHDSVAFSNDSRTLAAVACNTIRLWDVQSGKELGTRAGHAARVEHLSVSADGKIMVTHASDQVIIVWDVATGQEKQRFTLPYFIRNLAVSTDGSLLAFGGPHEIIHVWEAASGKERHALKVAGQAKEHQRGGEGGLAFSPDDTLLASKDSSIGLRDKVPATIRLWDLATGKEVRQFTDPQAHMGFHDLRFTPDGSLLAVMSIRTDKNDKQKHHYGLRFWDVAGCRFVREIQPERGFFHGFAFAPDGRTVALNYHDDKCTTLWEVATAGERGRLEGAGILNKAFTRDGKVLAASDWQQRLCYWDLRTGKLIGRHQSPTQMQSIAFLPDGRLASANFDTTVLLWNTAPYLEKLPEANGQLEEAALEQLWTELSNRDSGVASKAQARLRAAPVQAVAFVEHKLPPATALEARRVDKLIADLDNDDFAVRRQALDELGNLGTAIEPRLRKELAGNPPLETSKRLRELLDSLPARPLPTETLRAIRGVEVLEALAARKVLAKLAQGAPEARLTREARSALDRLGQ